MELIDLIRESRYQVVSVVGMAKNAGKTVTLNELINQSMENGVVLGLTSIGRDGESQDIVTCTQKPSIYVDTGTLIATAEGLYNCSDARLEILEMTEFKTSMGTIMIARAISPGYVQLAGPCANADIRAVSEKMRAYGAQLVIVDGALDRVSSAAPTISDAAVLATGAVLSRNMDKVIEKSIHQVSLFRLPILEEADIRKMAKRSVQSMEIQVLKCSDGQFEVEHIQLRTALGAGRKIAQAICEETKYVILPGSLVSKTLFDIAGATRHFKDVTFIVQDATKIFVESREWQLLLRKGLKVVVLDKINLLAVTINPYAPAGYYFDPKTFKERLEKFLAPVPVIDVMEGGVR
jgi:hypothetical protein